MALPRRTPAQQAADAARWQQYSAKRDSRNAAQNLVPGQFSEAQGITVNAAGGVTPQSITTPGAWTQNAGGAMTANLDADSTGTLNPTSTVRQGYAPAGSQGSVDAQTAAMNAIRAMTPFTQGGWTGAETNAYNQAAYGQNRASQAGIQALAQQAAARGMMNGGGMFAAQAGAAQQGANNLGQIGADIGMGAQQRQMGAIGQQFGMAQAYDAAAQGRGQAADAFNMGLLGMQLSALGQDRGQQQWQSEFDRQGQNQQWQKIQGLLGMIPGVGGGS